MDRIYSASQPEGLISFFRFDGGEEVFQAVQRGIGFGLENLAEVFDGVREIPDGFGHYGG